MSKFHLRIAGVQDTDIVCTKIQALCAFHDDQSKLDPAFFHKVLSDPETQLRVILAEDRGQVIGLMAYYPMFRLHSATLGNDGLFVRKISMSVVLKSISA